MKIIKRVLVNNKEIRLIADDIRLDLYTPGRASFTVQSETPLTGIIEYDAGWSDAKTYRYFTGYIEHSTTINKIQQSLFCRELSTALNRPVYLGLRHVTFKDVLNKISEVTGLRFVTPSTGTYTATQSPYIYHLGSGYQIMDHLALVYRIENYIWQQQADGAIYAGSYKESRWNQKAVMIPDDIFTRHLSMCSATLPMSPALRPGIKFNRGIIESTQIMGETMVIKWTHSADLFKGTSLN